MGKGTISQTGMVTAVSDDTITVNICSPEACVGCKAKDVCSAGTAGRDIIAPKDEREFNIGDSVRVSITMSMGMRAVAIAYMLPVILVVTIMVVMSAAGLGELPTGCTSLGFLVLYYIVLYFFRNKLSKEITFQIEK